MTSNLSTGVFAPVPVKGIVLRPGPLVARDDRLESRLHQLAQLGAFDVIDYDARVVQMRLTALMYPLALTIHRLTTTCTVQGDAGFEQAQPHPRVQEAIEVMEDE